MSKNLSVFQWPNLEGGLAAQNLLPCSDKSLHLTFFLGI